MNDSSNGVVDGLYPYSPREDLTEAMATPLTAEAFNQSETGLERNPVGFGHQDFVRINSLYAMGLVSRFDDVLVVKAHVINSNAD